jgi:hypothetical protein
MVYQTRLKETETDVNTFISILNIINKNKRTLGRPRMLFGSAGCLCTVAKMYYARGINILVFFLNFLKKKIY